MHGVRVLVVDDDDDHAHFVKRLLARLGLMAVDIAHSVAGAKHALGRRRYELVVSDYDLNPGSGIQLLEHVRAVQPHSRRILLTSAPDRASTEAQKVGTWPDSIWDKRWEVGTLRDHLRALLPKAAQ